MRPLTTKRMAGHDVLAITLRAIFYYLVKHPLVLSKLKDEIAPLNMEYSPEFTIPYSKLATLPYL